MKSSRHTNGTTLAPVRMLLAVCRLWHCSSRGSLQVVKGGDRPGLTVLRRVRRVGAVTAALFTGTATAALGLTLGYHLGVSQTLVTVLLSGGAPAALYLTWASYRLSAIQAHAQAAGSSMAEVADDLAVAVRAQWQAEAQARRLYDPYPLPVSWAPAEVSLVEGWNALTVAAMAEYARSGRPLPGTWATGPDALAGTGDQLADLLPRVPTGRLAVLGEPGSGKTMLMVQLVLDLLIRRNSGDQVPVLVSVASWDPTVQGLRAWLEARLSIDYPALTDAAPSAGARISRIRALLDQDMIMPILDGLDEIPDTARGPAIARINDAYRPGDRLVVTCRTSPFREAVRPAEGIEVTLRATAGIELRPLDANTLTDYLHADAGGPVGAARWDSVLVSCRTNSPLMQVLSNPLMAGLARIIYNARPGEDTIALSDPAELHFLPDKVAIQGHLFNAFISAVYRSAPGSSDHRSPWSRRNAEKWLIFLGRHLDDNIQGPDLAWWQFSRALPRVVTGIATGVAIGLATGLAIEIALPIVGLVYYGLGSGPLFAARVALYWMLSGLKFEPIAVLSASLLGGFAALVTSKDDQGPWNSSNFDKGTQPIVRAGCASGLMAMIAMRSQFGLQGAAVIVFLAGVFSGTAVIASGMAAERRGIKLNLRKGVLSGLAVGIVFGITFVVVVGYFGGLVYGIHFGVTFGILSGLAAAVAAVIADAGGQRPTRGLRWNIRRGSVAAAIAVIIVGSEGTFAFQSLKFGIVFAFALGIAGAVIVGLEGKPDDLSAATSPRVARSRDRATTLVLALATGAAGGLATALVTGLLYGSSVGLTGASTSDFGGPAFGLTFGLAFGLAFGIALGIALALVFVFAISGFGSSWPQWLIARGWLTLCRKLPVRLDEFLADAHKRGVLRQSGAVYQFRHVELQHQLSGLRELPIPDAVARPSPPCLDDDQPTYADSKMGAAKTTRVNRIALRHRLQESMQAITPITEFAKGVLRQGRRHFLLSLGLTTAFAVVLTGSLILAGVLPVTSPSYAGSINYLFRPAQAAPVIATSSPVASTEHFIFEPWAKNGLSKGLRITKTVSGYCWTRSAVANRSDAFRCFVGGYILDPCFDKPRDFFIADPEVACPYSGSTDLILIRLAVPLWSVPGVLFARQRSDWMIVLSHNDRCFYNEGAVSFVRGMRDNYSCAAGELYGKIRQGRVWRIFYQPSGSANMILVPIVATYS